MTIALRTQPLSIENQGNVCGDTTSQSLNLPEPGLQRALQYWVNLGLLIYGMVVFASAPSEA